MNNKIKTFLDNVCIHIKCKAVHSDIREELSQHINDLKDDFIKQGYDEEKALDKAISAMGNYDEIGTKLNKQHKPQTEWSLIILTCMIASIGGIVMYISSNFETNAVNFTNYLVYAALGGVVLIGTYFFDYAKLKKLAMPIYIGVIVWLIVGQCFGQRVNGIPTIVMRNFSISVTTLSPLILIAMAGFMQKYRGGGILEIIKLVALMTLPLIIMMTYPSFSMMFVIFIGFITMLTSAIIKNHFKGKKYKYLCSLYGVGIVGTLFIIFNLQPYRLTRFSMFLTRGKADPSGMGWQQVMADKWLSLSKMFGATKATVSNYTINSSMPGVTTDYILVNIITSLGWVVGVALVVAVAMFIVRMFFTTKKSKNGFGFYLSLTACTILATKFIISILANFSLVPLISINMPLVSCGGTDYVVSMFLIGLVLSVWRRNNLVSYKADVRIKK